MVFDESIVFWLCRTKCTYSRYLRRKNNEEHVSVLLIEVAETCGLVIESGVVW